MKKVFLFVLLILVSIFIAFRVIRAKVGHDLAQPVYQSAQAPTPTIVINNSQDTSTTLFGPNWTLESISDEYDRDIYFGGSPTKDGLNISDSVTNALDSFSNNVPSGKKTLLALEMQNTGVNGNILQSKTLQKKIVSQAVSLAKAHGFSGIVLDLEMGGIPFDALIDEINGFTKVLDEQARAQRLEF